MMQSTVRAAAPRALITGPIMTLPQAARYANIVLAAIAFFVAIAEGRSVFAPFVLAIVVGIVLSPIASIINRLGLPRVLGALLGLLVILVVLTGLLFLLEPLVVTAIEQAPRLWYEISGFFSSVQRSMAELDDVSEELSRAVNSGDTAEALEEGFAVPRLADALLLAPAVASQIMIFVGSLFFFLLSRTDIYEWAGRVLVSADAPRGATTVGFTGPLHLRLLQAERQVSRYFLTITVINMVFGVTVALCFLLLEFPRALMWGAVATLLNFIPYLGPAIVAAALALSGIVVFDGAQQFLPVAIFVALNVLEGQFITPALVGQHLQVNALAVFLSLVFWLWLWGPLGGFVAIPLLVWFIALATPEPAGREQPAPANLA